MRVLTHAVVIPVDVDRRILLDGAIAHDQARPGTQDLHTPRNLPRAVPQEGSL